MKKLLTVLLITVCFSCTNEEGSYKALTSAGYTDITLTGHESFACGNDDISCTGFTALGPSGVRTSGAVGCGAGCGKGCTIRIQ